MKVTKYLIAAVAVLTVCTCRADCQYGDRRTDSLLGTCRRRNVVTATDEAAELYRHDEETRTETCSR